MSRVVWLAIQSIGAEVVLVMVLTGAYLLLRPAFGWPERRGLRLAYRWTRRFFWLAFAMKWVGTVATEGPLDGWDAAFLLLDINCWWQLRDVDQDDDWKKKLKDAATGVVERVGNRLKVVAPSTA